MADSSKVNQPTVAEIGKLSINSPIKNQSHIFSNPFLVWARKNRQGSINTNGQNKLDQLDLPSFSRNSFGKKNSTVDDSNSRIRIYLNNSVSTKRIDANSGKQVQELLSKGTKSSVSHTKNVIKKLSLSTSKKTLLTPVSVAETEVSSANNTAKQPIIRVNNQAPTRKSEVCADKSNFPYQCASKLDEYPSMMLQSSTCIAINDSQMELSLNSNILEKRDQLPSKSIALKNNKLFDQETPENEPCTPLKSQQAILNTFSKRILRSVPCIYLQSTIKPKLAFTGKVSLILYFHANAEDIVLGINFLKALMKSTGLSVFSMEYPGYSMYPGSPSENQIFEDSEAVFEFVQQTLKIPSSSILVLGRSLGTAVASHVCTKVVAQSLVLLSPLASIGHVAQDSYGAIAKALIKDGFSNVSMAPNVRCPTLIVHGEKDDIILPSHSQDIKSKLS